MKIMDGWPGLALLPAINELKLKPFGGWVMWLSSPLKKILHLFFLLPPELENQPLTPRIQVMLVNAVSPHLFI